MEPDGVRIEGWRLVELWYMEYSNRISRLNEEDGLRRRPYVTMIEEPPNANRQNVLASQRLPALLLSSSRGFVLGSWYYSHDLNLTVVSAAAGLSGTLPI